MYAVVKTGGKQYRVSPGDKLRVESLKADEGDEVNLEEVLMIGEGESVTIGDPLIANASVTARVVQHGRDKKVRIIKFRRRKHHRKQMGHRQHFTELEIVSISGAGVSASAPTPKEEKKLAPEPAPAPTPAPRENGKLKFSDGPTGEPDDLKEISGVGPVLEKTLNDLGIYHFHQVAKFTAEDIAAVEEEANFPGRIERDNWIEQAIEFAKAKGDL